VKHNALFCTNYTAYRKKYVFSSGGSEKNRLITAADVRTGDLLPSRMRVAVLPTGQRLRRRLANVREIEKILINIPCNEKRL